MAFVPLAIMVASAVVGAAGAISSSKAQAASYKSQAEANNYNATVNRDNANAAMNAASANELAQRRTNAQRLGAMRAQIGSNGGGFVGTNLELADQDAATAELDALDTRYRGQMQARGLLAEANLDDFQAKAARLNASSATTAGYYGAASSILGSASNYSNARSLSTLGGGG
jgi:HD superfamily phosphodiesterase